MKYYLVEDLKVSVMYGKMTLLIKRGVYAANSRSSLRHVIGRIIWRDSTYDNMYQPYDLKGTSYLSKKHKITEVEKPQTYERIQYRYAHGIYYLKVDKGWTPLPDSEVDEYIRREVTS
jgi:hypothetical protein